jgi:hypothetical protein
VGYCGYEDCVFEEGFVWEGLGEEVEDGVEGALGEGSGGGGWF